MIAQAALDSASRGGCLKLLTASQTSSLGHAGQYFPQLVREDGFPRFPQKLVLSLLSRAEKGHCFLPVWHLAFPHAAPPPPPAPCLSVRNQAQHCAYLRRRETCRSHCSAWGHLARTPLLHTAPLPPGKERHVAHLDSARRERCHSIL